jgi:hypothetical protein
MGFLTNLVDNFFGKLQSGLAEEYQRQAKNAGVHPIVAKVQHESAFQNYLSNEKRYLIELEYYKNDAKELEKLEKARLEHLVEHWGSVENYELFKQKIHEEEERKEKEDNIKLRKYNKRVQKEKEDFLKNHGIK